MLDRFIVDWHLDGRSLGGLIATSDSIKAFRTYENIKSKACRIEVYLTNDTKKNELISPEELRQIASQY